MSELSKNYLKQIGVNFFWGTGFVAGNIIAGSMLPFTTALFRFIIAAIILVVFIYARGGKLPRLKGKEIWAVVGMAVFGMALYNFVFFTGLQTVEASYASMIMALNPVLVAAVSALVFREKLRIMQIIGIICSACGAIFIISGGNLSSLLTNRLSLGEICILLCLVSWLIYTLLNKIAVATVEPLAAITWACIIAAVVLIIPAYLESGFSRESLQAIDFKVWVALLYLGGLCSALSFTWYISSIRIIGAARSGVFYNLVPIFATITAMIILHERPQLYFFIGAVAIILGVVLTNYKKEQLVAI